MDRYRELRHLLVGAWYPLLPYSRDLTQWIASQYHSPDLNEGMVLAFRRPKSPYPAVDTVLYGLDANASYKLRAESTGKAWSEKGESLMKSFRIAIPEKHRSELITYRKASKP